MRTRLRVLEAGLSRLESHDEGEARMALYNVRGWSSQWRDGLTADERAELADWSIETFRLAGRGDIEAEADRIVLAARVRPYIEAERRAVCDRIGAHLVGMAEPERSRWRELYLGALHVDAVGSGRDGGHTPDTGGRGRAGGL